MNKGFFNSKKGVSSPGSKGVSNSGSKGVVSKGLHDVNSGDKVNDKTSLTEQASGNQVAFDAGRFDVDFDELAARMKRI